MIKNANILSRTQMAINALNTVTISPLCISICFINFFGIRKWQYITSHSIFGRSKPNNASTAPSSAYFKYDMWKSQCKDVGASANRRKNPENIMKGAITIGPKT